MTTFFAVLILCGMLFFIAYGFELQWIETNKQLKRIADCLKTVTDITEENYATMKEVAKKRAAESDAENPEDNS